MAFLQLVSLLLLMACCFTKPVRCQQLFSVQLLSRTRNNVTIRCEESNGDSVIDGLVFYRNGVSQLEDRCLSAGRKLENGRYMLQVSPSCEGHYMCGTSSNGGAKLSGPRILYAFPQLLPGSSTENRKIIKRLGDNANLPCSVERSVLDQFRVEWTKSVNGALMPASGSISDEDYSLTLTNVTFKDTGQYFCTVESEELQGSNRRLNGFGVDLMVAPRHIPPKFTRPAVYTVDEQGRREFMVTVEGSAGLMVQWFINNGQLLNSTSTPLPNNIVQSRLRLSRLTRNSRINVIASNIDSMTGQRFRTRTTILALFDVSPSPCPGATLGVIVPVIVLCIVLTALLIVAGLAIILILLKRRSKQVSDNPISDIFTNVGIFLQQNPQSELMDLKVLEGLSRAVGTILNLENLTLTDKAFECMENVKSSLEATKKCIRQRRRETNKAAGVVSRQAEPLVNTLMENSIKPGYRKVFSDPDSGIESARGSTGDSLDEVDGIEEEIRDEEIQKVDDLHETVTQWLKKCRVLKRQNAITDDTLDTVV